MDGKTQPINNQGRDPNIFFRLDLGAMIEGNLVRGSFPQSGIEVNYAMDALLSPVGDKRPEKLCESIRGWGKPKRKEPETKVSSLTLVKPGKTPGRTGEEVK